MTNGMVSAAFATSTALISAPSSACPSKKTSTARFRRRSLSCRASTGDNDGLLWLPRRDMMLSGLSGVAAGLALYPGAASGADTAKCTLADKVTDQNVQCTDPSGSLPCPLVSPSDPVPFTPAPKVTRVRKPVHLLTKDEVAKYKEAVARMRALDKSDPTNPLSFKAQAAIHEAYCDAHYKYEQTSKESNFDVHFSWLFAPWHRMYIYFYERALGDLIGDDTFALPYWNWDHPAGMVIPDMFKEGNQHTNKLNNPNRNPINLDALVDLEYTPNSDTPPIPFNGQNKDDKYKELVYKNLCTVYNQQFGLSADSFLGGKFCPEAKSEGQGTLERMAHTAMHLWVGKAGPTPPATSCTAESGGVLSNDGTYNCRNDMGFLGAAGRDPLFYSHHSNVDRMWYLWQTRLGGGDGFPDPDWLDASFVFYDDVKNPRKVRIKFSDVLDTRNLGYAFDAKYDKDLPWMRVKTTSLVPHGGKDAPAKSKAAAAAPAFPLALTKDKVVELPGLALPADKQPGKELLLVFDSVDYNPQAANKFDVAINVPADKAKKVGPQYKEYAGCFAVVPGTGSGTTKQTKVSLCINQVLFEIGADDDKTVDVVIVPRTHAKMTINTAPTIKYRE